MASVQSYASTSHPTFACSRWYFTREIKNLMCFFVLLHRGPCPMHIRTCTVYTNTVCRALRYARIIFSSCGRNFRMPPHAKALCSETVLLLISIGPRNEFWLLIKYGRNEEKVLHSIVHRTDACPSHGIHAKNVMQEIRLTHSKFNYSFFHSHESTISRALARKKPSNRYYYLFNQFAIVDLDTVATILITDCVGLCPSKLSFYEYSYFVEAARCHIPK